jgi:hypothetical protein
MNPYLYLPLTSLIIPCLPAYRCQQTLNTITPLLGWEKDKVGYLDRLRFPRPTHHASQGSAFLVHLCVCDIEGVCSGSGEWEMSHAESRFGTGCKMYTLRENTYGPAGVYVCMYVWREG